HSIRSVEHDFWRLLECESLKFLEHKSSTSAPGLLCFFGIQIIVKSTLTTEKGSERLASIARRVCWWRSADSTLEDTPLFVCQVMVFGTWADICFVLDHHGKAVFREA